MVNQVIVWSIPLLIIPVSLVVSRGLPFRTLRYSLYALFLVVSFILNLFQISFWNETADTAAVFLLNFFLADIFWNILKIKNRRVVTTSLVAGALFFGVANFQWFAAGPSRVMKIPGDCRAALGIPIPRCVLKK